MIGRLYVCPNCLKKGLYKRNQQSYTCKYCGDKTILVRHYSKSDLYHKKHLKQRQN